MKNEVKHNKLIEEFTFGTWNARYKDAEELQYHASWDWLRLAIIKISDINGYALPKQFKGLALDSPINMVYDAVVEFIKQYNKNK